MSNVASFAQVIREWASATPCVRRVWFFGSTIKASDHPNDLDVAVELERTDGEESEVVWSDGVSQWRRKLQGQLPVNVQLESFDPNGTTPIIASGLASGSKLVYDRENKEG